ncbi:MAG TPA: hypothetical protein VFB28_12965 [Terriglobales bacterium]|nr:hypothetical protein [Terriglobales bacterium]
MPYTLNGFGTRYYGSRDLAEDGSYITTLWVTALYVPLLPLGSYRVLPVGNGRNWIVHSSQSYMTRKVALCWEQIWHVYMVGAPLLLIFGSLIWASEKDDRQRKAFEERMEAVGSILSVAHGAADRRQSECWDVLKSSQRSARTHETSFDSDLQQHCTPAMEATDTYLQKIDDMQRVIERGLSMSALKDVDRAQLHALQGVWRIRHHQGEETKQILACLTDLTRECLNAMDTTFAALDKEDKDACSILATINEKCE